MTQGQNPYPVQFSVDYPEKGLNRLTTLLRPILFIPIFVVIALVGGQWSDSESSHFILNYVVGGGILFFAPLLLILFRQKYPRWWFDWNVALLKFSNRVGVYFFLLRDEYPSTDEEQAVHVEIPYPDVPNELNRWLPLVKWILAIPHYVALVILGVIALLAVIVAWFAILITGSYPRALFDYVVGVGRWFIRVEAYMLLLTTDRYPPFSLKP